MTHLLTSRVPDSAIAQLHLPQLRRFAVCYRDEDGKLMTVEALGFSEMDVREFMFGLLNRSDFTVRLI